MAATSERPKTVSVPIWAYTAKALSIVPLLAFNCPIATSSATRSAGEILNIFPLTLLEYYFTKERVTQEGGEAEETRPVRDQLFAVLTGDYMR